MSTVISSDVRYCLQAETTPEEFEEWPVAQADSGYVEVKGLAPEVVESWERRIGVDSGSDRGRHCVRLSGPDGAQHYWQDVSALLLVSSAT